MKTSLNNKRGQIFISLLGVVVLIIALAAFFFKDFRLYLIGVVLFVLAFIVLMSKSIEGRIVKPVLVLAFVGGGLIAFLIPGLFQQSVLGVSPVEFSNGNAYWVFTGTAESSAEELYYYNEIPKSATDPVTGVKYEPRTPVTLYVEQTPSYCEYQVVQLYNSGGSGVYELLNAVRVANINYYDTKGYSATLEMFNDAYSSPDGVVTITTEGATQGSLNCESAANVILFTNSDGTIEFKDKSEWEAIRQSKTIIDIIACWINPFCSQEEPSEALYFTNNFEELKFDGSSVKGKVNFGKVIYTINVRSDFYDSLIFTPVNPAEPEIINIVGPATIQKGDTVGVIVKVRNNGDPGNMNLKTTVSAGDGINPNSYSRGIEDTEEFSFSLKAGNNLGSGQVTFTACGVSQSGTGKCDSEIFKYNRVTEQQQEFCGDLICQANENFNICPSDCQSQVTCGDAICQLSETVDSCALDCSPSNLECGFFEKPITYQQVKKTTCNYIGIHEIPLVGPLVCEPPQVINGQTCGLKSWVAYAIITGIVLVFVVLIIVVVKSR